MGKFLPKTRVSEGQILQLKERAQESNITISDYIRKKLFGGSIPSKKANPEREVVIKTVSYVGHLVSELRAKNKLGEQADHLVSSLATLSKNLIKWLDGNSGKGQG